jgi:hypothetical protein
MKAAIAPLPLGLIFSFPNILLIKAFRVKFQPGLPQKLNGFSPHVNPFPPPKASFTIQSFPHSTKSSPRTHPAKAFNLISSPHRHHLCHQKNNHVNISPHIYLLISSFVNRGKVFHSQP